MRVASLVLVSLLAGCDSAGPPDVRPIADVMIVDLTDDQRLRLQTEGFAYCGVPIYVDSRSRAGVLEVEVVGAQPVSVACDALVPGRWSIGLPYPPTDVRIRHRGETDRYRIQPGAAGLELVAIRTSTTRPGPR